MPIRHAVSGHTAIACIHPTAHAVVRGYRSAAAADRHAAQTAPEGRRFEVRDNHPDPDQATALEVWCVPVEVQAAKLQAAARDKLTAAEFAAVVNAAKADAYRDVRRQLVWSTEAFKAKQIEMVQLSDDLADLVTANGGHYRKPSLNPRFPEGTPEYTEYAAKLRAALAEPGAFDFLEH